MQLSYTQKRQSGAFYTPSYWAELGVKYIFEQVSNASTYLFYDPAAGEGALLDALPPDCDKIASTLEQADVEILKNKGYSAFQFDFLLGNISNVKNSLNGKKTIVFTNPPYLTLPANQYTYIKRRYNNCNDATMVFIYRILNEIKPSYLALFSKADIYAGAKQRQHRLYNNIGYRSLFFTGFISPSFTWQGLKGRFPICFNILTGDDDIELSACSFATCFNVYTYEEGNYKYLGQKQYI